MTFQLVHTDNAPVDATKRARILVMGSAARSLAGALLRLQSSAEIFAANTGAEALDYLRQLEFEHVLVDNREDGALALTIPALARVKTIGRLTILAGPQSAEAISAIPGVDTVIPTPYNPVEIANSLGIDIVDNRNASNQEQSFGRRDSDVPEVELQGEVEETSAETVETEDMRPVFIKAASALAHFIPGLTPILSTIYKNTALTLLACLFIAFISYGVMIAYFLTASDWSTPLQLQRGHETVIKAERERGELQVKRNLVTQQLADAQSKADRGEAALKRADTLAQIAAVTIDQEIQNRELRHKGIVSEIKALKGVLSSYGSATNRRKERFSIQRDFKRRIITRRIYETSLLNLAEIEKNIVSLNEQISRKRTEDMTHDQGISYLRLLKRQLIEGDESVILAGGKAEFIPIANQIIEVQQIRASGKADIADFEETRKTLENSALVLTNSIKELESTPMIRALDEPVNVLFVPYDNSSAYEKDEPLYTCTFAIFWCSNVGSVGERIGGEIITTHPFFGKPIRGQFVEANLTEISAAQEEIIHVGRPPLFF